MRRPLARWKLAAVGLGLVAALPLLAQPDSRSAPPETGRIEAPLTGLRNLGKGQLLCLLYRKIDRIDADPRKALRVQTARPQSAQQVVVFEAVAPGEYAIAVVHDMDGDGRLATTLLGIPDEDLAISRNAKGGPLGGPKWDAAKVRLTGGTLRLEPMTVKYFYD